jgi:hypothetical protein
MVGMVVTISPSLSLYKMVVLPAASSPTMRIPTCQLNGSCAPKWRLRCGWAKHVDDDKWSMGRVVCVQIEEIAIRDVRISFLPKRPWSSLLTDRPIVVVSEDGRDTTEKEEMYGRGGGSVT